MCNIWHIQNYLVIKSIGKGTKVDIVAFSETKTQPVRIAFVIWIFSDKQRNWDQIKAITYPKRSSLPKATWFPVDSSSSARAQKEETYHSDNLFTSDTKEVHFLPQQLPYSVIPQWSILQKGLQDFLWRKLNWLLYRCWGKEGCSASLYWWQNLDVSNSNFWTLPEMALAGQELCFVLFCAKLYKWWHSCQTGRLTGLCSSSLGC